MQSAVHADQDGVLAVEKAVIPKKAVDAVAHEVAAFPTEE
jgi:hypothetical protein